jgi:hypothetical protein
MTYTCPVCGYDKLDEAPDNWNICDCCGTEFGYHDATASFADLRQKWIAAGANWWFEESGPPAYWSPVAQLRNIGYECTDSDLRAIAEASAGARDHGVTVSI